MQMGNTGGPLKPELLAIYGPMSDRVNQPLQRYLLCKAAIEMIKRDDPTQRDFDSRERSARMASATEGSKSRRRG